MRIAVQKLNRGVVLSKSRLGAEYQRYVAEFGRACHRLFSLGYQDTPSGFDRMGFVDMLRRDYPRMLAWFISTSGSYDFTYRRVSYILDTYKMDSDDRELLSLFHDVLKAEDGIKALCQMVNRVKFRKTVDTMEVRPRLILTSGVEAAGLLPLDNPLTWGAIALPDSYGLYQLDLSPVYVKVVAQDMGYTDKEIWFKEQNGESILFDGKSFADDCKWVDLLLDGRITGGRRFMSRYGEYYRKFFDENRGNKMSCVAYREYIFVRCLDRLTDSISEWRYQVGKLGGLEFFLTGTSMVFKSPVPVPGLSRVDIGKNRSEVFLGSCVVDYMGRRELSKQNALRGVSGEFVSEADVKRKGWITDGAALNLVREDGSCDRYYPIYCVRGKESGIPLKPLVGRSLDFTYTDAVDFCHRRGIYGMEDFTRYVEANYLKTVEPGLRHVVAKLVQGLVCVECDYTLKGNDSPDHVRFDSPVSDEVFQTAVLMADRVFSQLGL